MKYLKKFNTTSEYNAFLTGDSYILPNVSYIKASDSVFYDEIDLVFYIENNTFELPYAGITWGEYIAGNYNPKVYYSTGAISYASNEGWKAILGENETLLSDDDVILVGATYHLSNSTAEPFNL